MCWLLWWQPWVSWVLKHCAHIGMRAPKLCVKPVSMVLGNEPSSTCISTGAGPLMLCCTICIEWSLPVEVLHKSQLVWDCQSQVRDWVSTELQQSIYNTFYISMELKGVIAHTQVSCSSIPASLEVIVITSSIMVCELLLVFFFSPRGYFLKYVRQGTKAMSSKT